jgi:hypothetical protein
MAICGDFRQFLQRMLHRGAALTGSAGPVCLAR